MTPRSGAVDVARRLWAGAADGTDTPEDVAAAATCLSGQLRTGLGRWIGGEGYRALVARAHALMRAEHPVLDHLSCDRGEEPVTAETVRAHGTGAVMAGMVALVAALIEMLGRVVGEDMAVRLVEQTGTPSPRDPMSAETEGGHDG